MFKTSLHVLSRNNTVIKACILDAC